MIQSCRERTLNLPKKDSNLDASPACVSSGVQTDSMELAHHTPLFEHLQVPDFKSSDAKLEMKLANVCVNSGVQTDSIDMEPVSHPSYLQTQEQRYDSADQPSTRPKAHAEAQKAVSEAEATDSTRLTGKII